MLRRNFIHSRKNRAIFRKELEEKRRERIPPAQLPPLRPVQLYTASGLLTTGKGAGYAASQGLFGIVKLLKS